MTSTTGKATTDPRSLLRPRTLVAGLTTLREEVGRQLKDPTPAYAALGASDAVARRVTEAARQGAALAERVRRADGADATHLPRIAVGQALTVAGKLEEAYGEMATRGRGVAQRVRDGRQASELVRLAVVTVNRARPDRNGRASAVVVGETVTVTRATDSTDSTDRTDATSDTASDASQATQATQATDGTAEARAARAKAAQAKAEAKATEARAAAKVAGRAAEGIGDGATAGSDRDAQTPGTTPRAARTPAAGATAGTEAPGKPGRKPVSKPVSKSTSKSASKSAGSGDAASA